MRQIKDNWGLYAICVVLIYFLFKYLIQLKSGSPYWIQRTNLLFGPHAWIFFILVIVALISIFVSYKYNWIVISLPFFWTLLLPLKVGPGMGFQGSIINFFVILFQGNVGIAVATLFGAILGILSIVYLFIKNLKEIENKKFEIIFGIIIIILFLVKFF